MATQKRTVAQATVTKMVVQVAIIPDLTLEEAESFLKNLEQAAGEFEEAQSQMEETCNVEDLDSVIAERWEFENKLILIKAKLRKRLKELPSAPTAPAVPKTACESTHTPIQLNSDTIILAQI